MVRRFGSNSGVLSDISGSVFFSEFGSVLFGLAIVQIYPNPLQKSTIWVRTLSYLVASHVRHITLRLCGWYLAAYQCVYVIDVLVVDWHQEIPLQELHVLNCVH